jgi:hypothetical protein
MLRVRSLHLKDDDLNEYERFGLLDSNNKWKAGGMHAIKAVKDYWASGDYMPLELQPLARKMLEGGHGSLLPSKATRANFLKAGTLLLTKQVKSAKDASLAVGKNENWFVQVRIKYPGMWKQMELDYYRDLEETTERAKWEAKQKRIQSAADLADMASKAHKTILEDADVAPAVKMTAVKHVDDVLGVVGKRGAADRAAQAWMPTDQERLLLANSEIVVDAEVIDGPTGSDVP